MTRSMVFLGLVIAAMVALVAPEAMAQSFVTGGNSTAVGTEASNFISAQLRAGWGIAIGLVFAAYGLYVWLIKQETWGVLIILGGIFITLLPTFMDQAKTGVENTIKETTE